MSSRREQRLCLRSTTYRLTCNAAGHSDSQDEPRQPQVQCHAPLALKLLASSADGCTKALMLAHGFTVEQLVKLIRATACDRNG